MYTIIKNIRWISIILAISLIVPTTIAGNITDKTTAQQAQNNSLNGMSGEPIWIYNSDLFIRHVEVSDLNNDGILDVIAGEYDSTYYDNPSKVYAINGATGTTIWTYTINDGIRSMAIGDINNDGVDDVVIGASKGASTPDGRVHAVNGQNGAILWIFTPGASGYTNGDVAIGNFNGDAYLDVAVACWDDYVYAINGNTGSQLWATYIGSIFVNAVSTGDVNGDSIDDVAFAHSYLSGYSNYHGVLNGLTGAAIWIKDELNTVENCLLADFNNDSNLEAVFAVQTSTDAVKLQVRNALTGVLLWEYTIGIATLAPNAFLFAYDIDDDGDDDLVVGNEFVNYYIYAFDGMTNVPLWISEQLSGYARDIAFGDVVGDSQLNIIAATYDRVQVLEVNGTKTWYYAVAGSIYTVATADVNNDGTLDVIAGGSADATGTPPNPDKSVWALQTTVSPLLWEYTFGQYGNALSIVDLTGDIYMDVVTVSSLDDKATAINGQTGTSLWTWVGTENLYAVTTGDFDNNGQVDVAVAGADDMITALNGSTGGVLWQFTTPTNQIYRKCLQTMDVNGDGNIDVIAGADDSRVYAIDGATGNQLWVRQVGAAVNEVEIAQMDGSGSTDVVVGIGAGTSGKKIAVLEGATGSILWEYIMPEAVEHIEVFDITNDGVPDVAAAITPYNPMQIVMVDGSTHTQLWTTMVSSASNTHSMAHGDLNSDSIPDIIIPGRSTDMKVYALNGSNGNILWTYQTFGEINSVAVDDLNEDSVPDVIAGSDDQNVYAIQGYDGALLFSYSTAGNVMHVQTGDISGDGRPNIACVTFGSDGVVYAFNALPPSVNLPPYTPHNPLPVNGTAYVDPSIVLSWVGGDPNPQDIVTYDIYFGTTALIQVANNISATFYDPSGLVFNTTYYWQIVSWDDQGHFTSGPIWHFSTEWNNPPYIPSSPSPDNNSINVTLTPILSWVGGDPDGHTVTYDVYFGPAPQPPKVASNISASFTPGTLQFDTTYYWHVIAWDSLGKTAAGPSWQFTTKSNQPPYPPANPTPANESLNIPIGITLSWTGGDPDGHQVVYDVYLEVDDSSPDVLVASSLITPQYSPPPLLYESKYYWQIVARDVFGLATSGPIWHFTTVDTPEPELSAQGSLNWVQVPAGSTQTGSFTVLNSGEPLSLLDWEIRAWPEWGTWTFTPSNGSGLTPESGAYSIDVEVQLPNLNNYEDAGEITIVNIDNPSNVATIPVAVSTPQVQGTTQTVTYQFYKMQQQILRE
ncbi:MAG: VCBS repeat-containing protein [Candidatus Thermoplasmatota archaeon]|nr:VCBS repeat-containing protein [Candidatus Thermoplasmatota archaeon]